MRTLSTENPDYFDEAAKSTDDYDEELTIANEDSQIEEKKKKKWWDPFD